jgi:hypothetical protein
LPAAGGDLSVRPLAGVHEHVLVPQATDFPGWYQDVIAKAELAETDNLCPIVARAY